MKMGCKTLSPSERSRMSIQTSTKHLVQFVVSRHDVSFEFAYDVENDELKVFVGVDAVGGSLIIDLEELETWFAIVRKAKGAS